MNQVSPVAEFVSSPPEWGAPLRVWDVRRLRRLSESLPIVPTKVSTLPCLDRVGWYGEASHCGRLTVREVVEHARRIEASDIADPIILSADGFVFDGFHRLAYALLHNIEEVPVRQFPQDPEPDRVNPMPSWLTNLCLSRLEKSRPEH